MKLNEIKSISILKEGRVDPNVMMSLDMLINDHGAKTNTFQLLVLARMIAALKLGFFYKEPNFFEVTYSTSKDLLDTLRALEPTDLTAIAAKVRSLLDVKDKDLLYTYANPDQETLAWIKWAASREAND
jgi:hypothetical protein